MFHHSLPPSTKINRVIPKNSFDVYTNSKQKKLFVDLIEKIVWTNKLSAESINLHGKDISEIQVFEIQLRKREGIDELLRLINRAIPYHIVFVLQHQELVKISTSQKHLHPTNPDNTVIDWTFSSDWMEPGNIPFSFHLKQNLDFVFSDLCKQLVGKGKPGATLEDIIIQERKVDEVNKEIKRLQVAIKSCKQFNQKVDLNLKLQEKLAVLNALQG